MSPEALLPVAGAEDIAFQLCNRALLLLEQCLSQSSDGDDTHHAILQQDGQMAHVILAHQFRAFFERGLGFDQDHLAGHHI